MHLAMSQWHPINKSKAGLARRITQLEHPDWKECADQLLQAIEEQSNEKTQALAEAAASMRSAQLFKLAEVVKELRKVVPECGWVKEATDWDSLVQEAQTTLFQSTYQTELEQALESGTRTRAQAISLCESMEEVGCARLSTKELQDIEQALRHANAVRFEGRLVAVFSKHRGNPPKLRKHVEHEIANGGKGGTPVTLVHCHAAVRAFVEHTLWQAPIAASAIASSSAGAPAAKEKRKHDVTPHSARGPKHKRPPPMGVPAATCG